MTRLFAMMLMFVCALSVAQTTPRAKPIKPELISKYVRKIGLLYLQQIAELSEACEGKYFVNNAPAQEKCNAAIDRTDAALTIMESDVDIELSDSTQRGDIKTWELLKNAREAKTMSIRRNLPSYTSDLPEAKHVSEMWDDAKHACMAAAENSIKTGIYVGDGDCAFKILWARSAKEGR